MASRSDHGLIRMLAAVADVGVAHLRKRDLLVLAGRYRLTASVWRDVRDLWVEMEKDVPLLVGDAEGVWAFAYGKGLKVTNESWFKDINTLVGPE